MQRLVIKPEQIQNEQIILQPQQLHYLQGVLRLTQGDNFIAMDGRGKAWIAKLTNNSATILETLAIENRELSVAVTLMVALPKGNGFDEIVRCCTELGVSTFFPVISDRTLLKPSEKKLARWQRIATEAVEQSERLFVPTILPPTPFSLSLNRYQEQKCKKYICVARGNSPHLLTCLQKLPEVSQDSEQFNIIVATGCEGGWTPEEIEKASLAGFQGVSLGKRVLRAITAPMMVMSLIGGVFEE